MKLSECMNSCMEDGKVCTTYIHSREAIEAKNREQHNVRGLEMNNLETRNQAIQ